MAEERALKTAMTPELWQRLKPLYDAAVEMPETDRSKFADEACGNDSELRKELAALLKASAEPTGSGDAPIVRFGELFPPTTKPFSIGELVLGRFKIVSHLGTGGMGEVYEAMDLELGRIALKTIRPDVAGNPATLARFRKEVQLARKISGPHVCRIHELFVVPASVDEPQKVFLTMEFLDGVTLADKIASDGPLPWEEARLITLQMCDGLHTIHEAGVIHRDLKSHNIMLASRNGSTHVVLMDFGLAREFSRPAAATVTAISVSGAIAGTPDYMAPEQFAGRALTPATDIYALGIVLYELVTGKHPFAASSLVGAAVQRGQPPCLASSVQPGLPRRCDEVICKCLEYDPKHRYQSARELEQALRLHSLLLSFQRKWVGVTVGFICIALILAAFWLIPPVGERLRGILFSSREKHIAVLPLDFVGGNPEAQALGDGLMDSLAGKLANLNAVNQSLWVIPASEVRSRKVTDPSSALREFGATIVVKGRFERNDQATRLKLTLIDPRKTREIGYVDVDSQTGDLAALQDKAVARLCRLMNVSYRADSDSGVVEAATRPAYEDYLIALGYIQRFDKPGNLDLAIVTLITAVKTDPRFALGFARLAQVYDLKYRIDSNPDWLRQAEAYGKQAAELDTRIPLTYVVLGNILEDKGNYELAVERFQRALDLDPRNAEALAGIASSYAKAGRTHEAEMAYINSASLRPNDWSGPDALGNFYDSVGRHKEAIAQFRRAIELSPDNSALYLNLGDAMLNSGDPKMLAEARGAFEKSIAMNPTYEAYSSLGVLFEVQHRYREGLDACEKATRLNDNNYDAWNNLALAYEWSGDAEKAKAARKRARDLAESALTTDARNAQARAVLAALMAKEGMRDKAIENIKISLTQAPQDQYVLSEAADVYALLGDRHRAISCLRSALKEGAPADLLNADPDIQNVLPAVFQTSGK